MPHSDFQGLRLQNPNLPNIGMSSISEVINNENSVEAVNSFIHLMHPIHFQYTKQWFLNISNFIGNQWLALDHVTGRFVLPRAPSWRIRLSVNRILPIARTLIAKLRDVTPRIYVSPQTIDQIDKDAASVATKVSQSYFNSTDFLETRNEITLWQVLCGNAYTIPLYDEKAGREIKEISRGEDGQPLIDKNGDPVTKTFSTGDILIESGSPFEIVPDFSTPSFREQNAMVRRKVRSIDHIFQKYGVKVDPEPIGEGYTFERRIMNMVSNRGQFALSNRTLQQSAIVKEMWTMPSKKFPNGRHVIVANNKELFTGDLPSFYKRAGKVVLPPTHMGGIEVPGRLLDMSPVENLLELQWHYNRGRSQIIENINMLGKPKVFAPMDSVPDGAYTDEPGEIIEYNPNAGPAPVVVPPPTIPNYHLDNLNRLQQEMEDVAGVHEISLGRLPRRATSGVALSILEEKDTTIIAPMRQSLARGIARTFSLVLSIAEDKLKDDKMIAKIVGGNTTDIFGWKGSDLKNQTDVRVLIDQPFPQSRAAKLEFAINLVRTGILKPEQALRILELDDIQDVAEIAESKDAISLAKIENAMILKGETVSAGKYEDHISHIKEHQKVSTDRRITDEIRIESDRHIDEHRALQQIVAQPPLTQEPAPATLNQQGGQTAPPGVRPI